MKNRSRFINFLILIMFCSGTVVFGANVSVKTWELKKQLLQERNNPYIRAFLDTISLAEGTYYVGVKGYKMFYGNNFFDSFEEHPDTVHCCRINNKEVCSSAAGRYMFLKRTWDTIAEKLDLHDFSLLNQDVAAIYLMYEKNALQDIKQNRFKESIAKVKDIWASLPGSLLNQPTKQYRPLRQFYEERLRYHMRLRSEGGWRLW